MSRLIQFIRSRTTETWLGLWAAIVVVLSAFGIEIPPGVTAAVAAAFGWVVTFITDRTEGLGPLPKPQVPPQE